MSATTSASTPSTAVNTKHVTDHRAFRFNSIDDLLADLDQIEASYRAATLRTTGNWTPGQILGHLATWCEFNFTGVPISPPWLLKIILKLMKNRFIRGPMPRGVLIPKVQNGTLGTAPREFHEALAAYRATLLHLKREAPTKLHPIFGQLTHDDAIKMQLRHAELHLGYMHLR